MKTPSYAIDTPTPYDPPEVIWAFLRSLRDLDQSDPSVQDARRDVLQYLVVENRHERKSC